MISVILRPGPEPMLLEYTLRAFLKSAVANRSEDALQSIHSGRSWGGFIIARSDEASRIVSLIGPLHYPFTAEPLHFCDS